jgi:nucleotide-binding universal stress UspA family protein
MKKILVAVDFSKNTGQLMEQAALLAKGLTAKVWIVHVTSDPLQAAYAGADFYGLGSETISPLPGDIEMARDLCADEYKREHQALMALSSTLRQKGIDAQAILLKGDAAGLILEQAENLDVNLVVMGSHGHSLLRKVLVGSVTEAVLRDALCNVLIVPAPLD